MDFGYAPEQEALRQEVRAFIAEHLTPEVVSEMEGLSEGFGVSRSVARGPLVSELFQRISERGWLGISYPKEYGGQDGDRMSQYIVEEEFARVNIAVGLAGSGAPAILAAGTEEQKRHFIPRLISGEFSFALGFTEPQAGADLASLQCRAARDGDEYVINGQKMYTSAAHNATHIYLMARTNPDVPKHQGISIFLVPIEAPGITVRPLWTIQNDPRAPLGTTYGAYRTNETFFDDVRVSGATLLGEENQGFFQLVAKLPQERMSIAVAGVAGALEAIRHEFHLDEPLVAQYIWWIRGVLSLDFGTSIVDRLRAETGGEFPEKVTAFRDGMAVRIRFLGGDLAGAAEAAWAA